MGLLDERYKEPEIIEAIREMAAQGLTREFICRILKLNYKTFEFKREFDPKIDEAIADGVAMGANMSGMSLSRRVKEGDMTAIKWYETSRGYRKAVDQVQVEMSGTLKTEIDDATLEVRLRELEKKMEKDVNQRRKT